MEQTKLVLVVEDDPRDFDEFERLLASIGYAAIRKQNGMPIVSYHDAIGILKSGFRIECALLDINLAGEKTGVDVAQYILQNRYPIKIIFTTAHLADSVAEEIAFVGTQFGTIPKPNGTIDSKVSLFGLRQALAPSNPLQEKIIENIFVTGKVVDPIRGLRDNQKYDSSKAVTQVIEKQSCYCIMAGNSERIKVPKNYCLILTTHPKFAVLVHQSLDKFIEETLDNSFVRINEHACINLLHFESIVERGPKFIIVVNSSPFEVSKKYRSEFQKRLQTFKLVPKN